MPETGRCIHRIDFRAAPPILFGVYFRPDLEGVLCFVVLCICAQHYTVFLLLRLATKCCIAPLMGSYAQMIAHLLNAFQVGAQHSVTTMGRDCLGSAEQ